MTSLEYLFESFTPQGFKEHQLHLKYYKPNKLTVQLKFTM